MVRRPGVSTRASQASARSRNILAPCWKNIFRRPVSIRLQLLNHLIDFFTLSLTFRLLLSTAHLFKA
ncbi:MAG: hypothetical protein A2Z86_08710 [Candidatus Glassbacteria bacterium GWA2_58_10]|uniref:Uncharacterized protein n=1 Tax=Candidatus Glassbacteria bacterium GWA2_58_10 TaxID=1817865 RepID=A0A1F5YFQ5_9BACT|nr:MAG: hypothetical protein A2Z86_08710 [Candidatus Glassbacteria bacterium GWA2_58_10]